MKKIYIAIAMFCSHAIGFAESMETVMNAIKGNNLMLKSLFQNAEADKRAERAINNLTNPEVEGSYQWGKPGNIGNKQTFTATQSFDFPGSYYYRSKVVNHKIAQREAILAKDRSQVLLQARNLCIELIYLNQLSQEYKLRLDHAKLLFDGVAKQFELGDVNILDLNKAKLNLMNAQSEYASVSTEKEGKELALIQMNGGINIQLTQDYFPTPEAPVDFHSWYGSSAEKNPDMRAAFEETEASKRALSLSKSNGLPKFSLGYTMEHLADELFQGAVVGMSIPLWENRNQVRQARARKFAAELQYREINLAQKAQFEEIYKQLVLLEANCKLYNETLSSMSNDNLLLKAYQKGELSLLEYLMELSYYYDTKTKALELCRNYNIKYNELMQYSFSE